jgi:DNA-binding winged helix-turn-helix (wHTH) protein
MARKGRQMKDFDWLVAFELFFKQGEESYQELPVENEPQRSRIIASPHDLEINTMKKDLLSRLSREAKEVLYLICWSPDRILKTLMTGKYKVVSKDKIFNHLKSNGWKPCTINNTFSELKQLTKELQEIE